MLNGTPGKKPPTPSIRRRSSEQRRALQMLADIPHGLIEELLVLAHGFDSDMIAGLVRAGLATARRETIRRSGKPTEVVRIRITDAGWQALETGAMPKRPSPHKPQPSWNIYHTAGKAKWIGSVKAANPDAAIEAAAVEFNTDAWKLIAVRRFEIA
jgi:hypothetical protein